MQNEKNVNIIIFVCLFNVKCFWVFATDDRNDLIWPKQNERLVSDLIWPNINPDNDLFIASNIERI